MFEELLHLLTLVNPTTSGFPLKSNNNKLINEAGSLCSFDSVESSFNVLPTAPCMEFLINKENKFL